MNLTSYSVRSVAPQYELYTSNPQRSGCTSRAWTTTSVTDGPFIEAKEVLGGYWLVDAASKEDVVRAGADGVVEFGSAHRKAVRGALSPPIPGRERRKSDFRQ